MTVQASKKIRALLKTAGYGKADVSVYNKSYSMGSTVYVTIRRAEIPLGEVDAIAAQGEEVRRDARGDILEGGNCFVDTRYAGGVLDAATYLAEAQIKAGRWRFGSYTLLDDAKDPTEMHIWKACDDASTGSHVLRVDRQWAAEGLVRVLAKDGMLGVLDQPEPAPEPVAATPEAAPVDAVLERLNEAAASLGMVRANSFLSPILIAGAEQHEADYLGACIDNLVEPVRRGDMTAREALERMARTAFSAGRNGR